MRMKKEKRTVIWVGIVILLLAVMLILLSIFLPRARYKSRVTECLELMLSPDPTYVTLTDPLFDTGDLLGRNGKEVQLQGEQMQAVLSSLGTLRDAGFHYQGQEQKLTGAWDLRLLVRTASGESVQLRFEADRFYYTEGDVAYFFTPKDAAAYRAFYERLIAILQAE